MSDGNTAASGSAEPGLKDQSHGRLNEGGTAMTGTHRPLELGGKDAANPAFKSKTEKHGCMSASGYQLTQKGY